jgi:MFS family permease
VADHRRAADGLLLSGELETDLAGARWVLAKTAALGSALLNVGDAVLGLGVGQFGDRWGGRRVMSAIFVAGGLSLALAGAASGSAPLLMVTIVLAGTAWIAGQAAMVTLVARSYPDEIRATGVG